MAYVKIRPRRSTKAEWDYANPILSEGEIAVEVPNTGVGTGISKFKIGDGVTPWQALPYAIDNEAASTLITSLQQTVTAQAATIVTMLADIEALKEGIVTPPVDPDPEPGTGDEAYLGTSYLPDTYITE